MASATVIVDDAVLCRLPPVCAIDGVPTDDRLTFSQPVGSGNGIGIAWLLLLAGPPGCLGLVLIAAFRQGGETLTVTLPYCEATYRRRVAAEHTRRNAVLMMAGAAVVAVVAALQRTTDARSLALGLAAVACGALIGAIAQSVIVHRLTIHLALVASRRWVTFMNIHPDLLAAIQDRYSDSHFSTP